jgi:enamine deaminase RidA (YjgF/YER057c/UK114 family)
VLTTHRTLLPAGWNRPKGYANGISAAGRLVLTAGIVGWDENEQFQSTDLVGQFRQVLTNMVAILAEAGAKPEHVARMTWYLVSRENYVCALPEIGQAYREIMGGVFPTMAVVEVSALVEPKALIEIETTAIVPD